MCQCKSKDLYVLFQGPPLESASPDSQLGESQIPPQIHLIEKRIVLVTKDNDPLSFQYKRLILTRQIESPVVGAVSVANK